MRCGDCNKFVSMDNGDPQVENLDQSFDKDGKSFNIQCTVTGTRICADCGKELKTLSMDMEDDVDLSAFDGFKDLSPEDQEAMVIALRDGSAEIDIDENSAEVEESGGGRYAKNIITTKVQYTLTVTATLKPETEPVEVFYTEELSSENAASEFEEC